jgi:hypothetical protein
MYRHIKFSHVLASIMAMALWLPGSAVWADEGRYDNDGHRGRQGWNGHYEGYRGNHAPDHRYYNRGYHTGYYPHYYPQQQPCGRCTQKKQHNHNNHNNQWWHFW